MQKKKKGLYILDRGACSKIYGPDQRERIGRSVDIYAPPLTAGEVKADLSILTDAALIFGGWGMATLDAELLAAAPELEAVFYGSGSIKARVTDAFWDRDIIITTAAAANAVPVAEFAFSQIIFSLKRGWHFAREIRDAKDPAGWRSRSTVPGAYGTTVGLVSLGLIARDLVEKLKMLDVNVIAYDPFVAAADATALGVELCGLDALFARANVVSLHTPWLPETVGMITGEHFGAMPTGATFINTARGAIVREDEMVAALRDRTDVFAILDVTYPEPPPAGSSLYELPNVVLTPHIAGSMDAECRRMGQYMVDELNRYLADEPLRWSVTREQAERMA